MTLPPWLARFNRRVTNRLTRHIAGWMPGFGILIHTGRRSGKQYPTPINVFRVGRDYILALTYGPNTDWVRNVLAAGGAELVTRGRLVGLTNPRLGVDTTVRWAPLPVRVVLRLVGVHEYMRLTRTASAATTE